MLWGRAAEYCWFHVLRFPRVERVGNKTTYTVGTQTFTEDEVLVLPGGVDPNDLYAGYSPSEASRRWATLVTSLISRLDFQWSGTGWSSSLLPHQRGNHFRERGDVARRSSRAGNLYNVTYTHRPVDSKTGKPSTTAAVEWVPFTTEQRY